MSENKSEKEYTDSAFLKDIEKLRDPNITLDEFLQLKKKFLDVPKNVTYESAGVANIGEFISNLSAKDKEAILNLLDNENLDKLFEIEFKRLQEAARRGKEFSREEQKNLQERIKDRDFFVMLYEKLEGLRGKETSVSESYFKSMREILDKQLEEFFKEDSVQFSKILGDISDVNTLTALYGVSIEHPLALMLGLEEDEVNKKVQEGEMTPEDKNQLDMLKKNMPDMLDKKNRLKEKMTTQEKMWLYNSDGYEKIVAIRERELEAAKASSETNEAKAKESQPQRPPSPTILRQAPSRRTSLSVDTSSNPPGGPGLETDEPKSPKSPKRQQ